jgi:non-heme Fe2+,alpha-ketoglutarate-dependent halogenase
MATATAAASAAPDQRVFAFQPSSRRPLRRLRSEQRDEFDQQGFVACAPIFTAQEMVDIRGNIDRLLQVFHQAGKDSYAMAGFQASCASIYDLVMEPRILDCVEDVLGPDFVCWSSHCFCKMPHDGKTVSWHQDAPYWGLTPTHTVTAYLAIDDVDPGNGSLQVIPGSHRHGAIPMRASLPEEQNVLWLTTEGYERFGAPQATSLRAGELSLHSDLLLHGSPANTSDRRRCTVAIRYATMDVRLTSEWKPPSIRCRGVDPLGYWPHHPRPTGDQPFPDLAPS